MTLFYLDSGLRSVGDHSYGMARSVRPHLIERFGSCEIFASADIDGAPALELEAHRHFTKGLYDHVIPRPAEWLRRLTSAVRTGEKIDLAPSELASFAHLNDRYRKDIENLPARVWKHDNVMIFPGIMQHQMYGLAAHLATIPRHAVPLIIIGLMFDPSYVPWGTKSLYGKAFYERSFAAMRPLINSKIFFVAENAMMAAAFTKHFDIVCDVLPIPLGATCCPDEAPETSRPRLGFFGYSKSEKGFHLLPEALDILRSTTADFDVTIQVQHSNWEPETVAAEARLRKDPRNRILTGALDHDEFLAETANVNVVLLPYDPDRFGMRGSGLFTEAVAAGRLVVASHGTYSGLCIERGEAEGETFTGWTAEALAEAIARLFTHFPEALAEARARARHTASPSSGEAYANIIGSYLPERIRTGQAS